MFVSRDAAKVSVLAISAVGSRIVGGRYDAKATFETVYTTGEASRKNKEDAMIVRDEDTGEETAVTESSGNVFADLGLPNADARLVRADLAIAIVREIRTRGWTQAQAAERLGVAQPDVSNLKRGRLDGFSQERLLTMLRRLGVNIEITLNRPHDGIGTLNVHACA